MLVDLLCIGCGIKIQFINYNKKGYVPDSKKSNLKNLVCQRCFKIKHYGEFLTINNEEFSISKITNFIKDIKNSVGFVIDIFTLGEIKEYEKLIKKYSNNYLIINKIDLLPKVINKKRLITNVELLLKKENINIQKIFIISALKNQRVATLFQTIFQGNKNFYLIGNVNSGKSTIINQFIKYFSSIKKNYITISPFPNTTIDQIKIKIPSGKYFIDLPGIYRPKSLFSKINPQDTKKLQLIKEVKPITFQIFKTQRIFIDRFVILDIAVKRKIGITFFLNSNLLIHRTSDMKNQGHNLKFKFKDFTKKIYNKKINFENNQIIDIEFSELGFLRLQGNATLIIKHADLKISIRNSVI